MQKQTKWIKMHQSQVNICFQRGPLRWLTEQKNPNFLWSLQNTQCDTMNLAITSLKERSQNSLLWHWLKENFLQGAKSCSRSLAYLIIRRGSTPVSTVLRKSVRFFIINIFLIIIVELSKLKSGKWSVQMFSFSSFRALDRSRGKGASGS